MTEFCESCMGRINPGARIGTGPPHGHRCICCQAAFRCSVSTCFTFPIPTTAICPACAEAGVNREDVDDLDGMMDDVQFEVPPRRDPFKQRQRWAPPLRQATPTEMQALGLAFSRFVKDVNKRLTSIEQAIHDQSTGSSMGEEKDSIDGEKHEKMESHFHECRGCKRKYLCEKPGCYLLCDNCGIGQVGERVGCGP